MKIEGQKRRFKSIVTLPLILMISFAISLSGIMNAMFKRDLSTVKAAENLYPIVTISEYLKTNTIQGNPDPNLPWFSGTFVTFFDGYSASKTTDELQSILNQEKDWYAVGNRCMTVLGYMLSVGVEFKGITLHLLQDVTVGSGTTYLDHFIVGDNGHPFDGTFDGAGKVVTISAGLNSRPVGGIVNAEDYLGFFGFIRNAVIKNLTVKIDSASPSWGNVAMQPEGYGYIGGIAAYAEGSTIINCVSQISFTEKWQAKTYTEHTGAIVGYAKKTDIVNCVDVANNAGLYGDKDSDSNIINSTNHDEWDALGLETDGEEKQKDFIREMNQTVFYYMSHLVNEAGLLFWGIGTDGYPMLNSPNAIYDDVFAFQSKLKQFAFKMVEFSYLDNSGFVDDETVEGQAALVDMENRYNDFLTDLSSLTIYISCGECPGCLAGDICENPQTKSYMTFFDEAAKLISDAILDFDKIYYIWSDKAELDAAISFKEAQITKLETAKNDFLRRISDAGTRAKIVKIFEDAMLEIDEISFEDHDWSLAIVIIVSHAETEFNRTFTGWSHTRLLIGIIVVACLVFAAGITSMIIYTKKKYRKFAVGDSIIEEERGTKASHINQKAKLMAQILELQREKTDNSVRLQKEKAKIIEDAQNERSRILAQALQDKQNFETERANIIERAKQEKSAAIELTRKQMAEMAAQVMKEKLAEIAEKYRAKKEGTKEAVKEAKPEIKEDKKEHKEIKRENKEEVKEPKKEEVKESKEKKEDVKELKEKKEELDEEKVVSALMKLLKKSMTDNDQGSK